MMSLIFFRHFFISYLPSFVSLIPDREKKTCWISEKGWIRMKTTLTRRLRDVQSAGNARKRCFVRLNWELKAFVKIFICGAARILIKMDTFNKPSYFTRWDLMGTRGGEESEKSEKSVKMILNLNLNWKVCFWRKQLFPSSARKSCCGINDWKSCALRPVSSNL